jgi:spore coat polysaccharide biosynthesis protein SpsF (cytidylyltransferase family)
MEDLPHMNRSELMSVGYRRGPADIHIIRSVGDMPAMSVHIYDHAVDAKIEG